MDLILLGGDKIHELHNRFEAIGYVVSDRFEARPPSRPVPYLLLARSERTSPLMMMDRDVLAIGVGAPGLQLAFPWITRGPWPSLEDYEPEFLDRFDSIVMWEPIIRDVPTFEERVRGLLAAEKQIVINPGRVFGPLAFGVSSGPMAMEGTYAVGPAADSDDFNDIGDFGPFSFFGGGWRGHSYEGTDGTEGTLTRPGAEPIPLLPYKEVEGRRLYFDAADLLLLVSLNKDEGAVTFLMKLLGRVKPNTETTLQPLASTVERGLDHQRVTVEMPDDGWVVLSESFSPAWKIASVGEPVPYYPFENMMSFPLPEGQHMLELSYGMTPIQKVSLSLSVVSLALLVLVAARFHLLQPSLDPVSKLSSARRPPTWSLSLRRGYEWTLRSFKRFSLP